MEVVEDMVVYVIYGVCVSEAGLSKLCTEKNSGLM